MIKKIEVSFHALAAALDLTEDIRIVAVDGDLTNDMLTIVAVDAKEQFIDMVYDAHLRKWVRHESKGCYSPFP